MMLVGQAYWWWKDSHIDDQCWFVLQDHLHTLYALHLLYAYEVAYNEPNVDQEPKPESQPILDICTKLLNEIWKLVASQTAEVDVEPEPELLNEPEPEIVDEPDPESEVDHLIETHVNFLAEPTMKWLSSLSATRVPLSIRLPDVYDPLQIFLEATGSQEVEFLMVQSTISPVFSKNDLPRHVASVLFEVPSTAVGWSRKPVPPPPTWFSHDASMLILRPLPWPDWEFVMWFDPVVFTFYLPLHSSGMNVFKPGRMIKSNCPNLAGFKILI